MEQLLSEDRIAEYRECFNLYDKEHRGRIVGSDLIDVMRSLGACPTPAETAKHLASIKKKRTDTLDFSQFLNLMQKQMGSENVEKEIMEAMRMSDSSKNGTISVAELRYVLMNFGEKLTAKEVDQMFRTANVKGNRIKYKDFVATVSMPVPDY